MALCLEECKIGLLSDIMEKHMSIAYNLQNSIEKQ